MVNPTTQAKPRKSRAKAVPAKTPPWAVGVTVIIGAIAALILGLNLNFGSIIDKYQNTTADQNKIQAEMLHGAETRVIDALNNAINKQSLQIAQLSAENQDLKIQIVRLQVQVEGLIQQCNIIVTPTPVPKDTEK